MTKEEYIKFVKENEEMSRFVEIAAQLTTIKDILIRTKLCSEEEFDKLKQIYAEKVIEEKYKLENKEDLKTAKKINDFMKMFSGE